MNKSNVSKAYLVIIVANVSSNKDNQFKEVIGILPI